MTTNNKARWPIAATLTVILILATFVFGALAARADVSPIDPQCYSYQELSTVLGWELVGDIADGGKKFSLPLDSMLPPGYESVGLRNGQEVVIAIDDEDRAMSTGEWSVYKLCTPTASTPVSSPTPESELGPCPEYAKLDELLGYEMGQPIDGGLGMFFQITEDAVMLTLPSGYKAVGDGKTIEVGDADRTLFAGPWSFYRECGNATATPEATNTPLPQGTPQGTPVVGPCPEYAKLDELLGYEMGQPIDGGLGMFFQITEDAVMLTLPSGYKAVGDGKTIEVGDADRTLFAGPWSFYRECGNATPTPTPGETPVFVGTPQWLPQIYQAPRSIVTNPGECVIVPRLAELGGTHIDYLYAEDGVKVGEVRDFGESGVFVPPGVTAQWEENPTNSVPSDGTVIVTGTVSFFVDPLCAG